MIQQELDLTLCIFVRCALVWSYLSGYDGIDQRPPAEPLLYIAANLLL